MGVIRSNGPTRCSLCGRTKTEAIQQQVDKKDECDTAQCVFKQEIREAIEKSKKPKITIRRKEPPKIKITRKK